MNVCVCERERGRKGPPGRGSVFASVFAVHVNLTFVFAGEEASCLTEQLQVRIRAALLYIPV